MNTKTFHKIGTLEIITDGKNITTTRFKFINNSNESHDIDLRSLSYSYFNIIPDGNNEINEIVITGHSKIYQSVMNNNSETVYNKIHRIGEILIIQYENKSNDIHFTYNSDDGAKHNIDIVKFVTNGASVIGYNSETNEINELVVNEPTQPATSVFSTCSMQ